MELNDVVDLATAVLRGRARRAVTLVVTGCLATALWAVDATAFAPARTVGCVLLNETLDRAQDQLDYIGKTVAESQGTESQAQSDHPRFPGC